MKFKNVLLLTLLASVLFVGFSTIIGAVGSGGGDNSGTSAISSSTKVSDLYNKGAQADKDGDYKAALKYFQDAYNLDRTNPDVLNMLAHTQRMLGKIDEALDNYKKALSIKPNFPEAREYLGEAYIQAALREISTLKGYGSSADTFRNDLIEKLKDAAANIK